VIAPALRPFRIAGKVVHQVGMPWRGWEGVVTGDVVNQPDRLLVWRSERSASHEGKAFVGKVEKA